ncbi:hypothetical protein F5B20DRAFT_582878 [Whalleya microplaca]|nr:hypothetical protein F5B20DRAFT_582878 [Whalleya microplaca]
MDNTSITSPHYTHVHEHPEHGSSNGENHAGPQVVGLTPEMEDKITPFTFPAVACAHALGTKYGFFAIVLAECEVEHLIFREFLRDFWAHRPDGADVFTEETVRSALRLFRGALDLDLDLDARPRWHAPTDGSGKDAWGTDAHLAQFLLRTHDWVRARYPAELPVDAGARARVFLGVLGVLLKVEWNYGGEFPDGPIGCEPGNVALDDDYRVRFDGDWAHAMNFVVRQEILEEEVKCMEGFLQRIPLVCEECGAVDMVHAPACPLNS